MSIFNWLFYCCKLLGNKGKENLVVKPEIYKGEELDIIIKPSSIFPDKYYMKEEMGKVIYVNNIFMKQTKDYIIDLIDKEIDNKDNYQEFYNNNGLVLYKNQKGTILNTSIIAVKMIYKIPKDKFPNNISIKKFEKILYNTEIRTKWDTSFKELKVLESTDEYSIVYSRMNSPIKLFSEREFIEKVFRYSDDKCLYNFGTSVDDDLYKISDNVVRSVSYFDAYKIWIQDNFFCFSTISQINNKSYIPPSVFINFMPKVYSSWYDTLIKYISNNEI